MVPHFLKEKGTCMRETTTLGRGVLAYPAEYNLFFLLCADAFVAWQQSSLLHRQVTGD